MSNNANINAVRQWLMTCPAIQECGDDSTAFRVNILDYDAIAFSIEDAPGQPVTRRYIRGTGNGNTRNYVVASRQPFSADTGLQTAVSATFEDITAWIDAQNNARNFPDLGGRQVRHVEVTNRGYIYSETSDTCIYQMQIAIEYNDTITRKTQEENT